jgi:hypothetical protein
MKIAKETLKQIIAEEVQQVLNEGSELSNVYGAIMNLLMGRGQWENAGGTEQGRKEAYDILLPHLSKMMKIVIAQQKKR